MARCIIRMRTRSRIMTGRTRRRNKVVVSTFLDIRDMSMLSSPAQPEMYTVESGSEASFPLKEHRVA